MTAVAELSTTPQDWIAGTWTIDPAHTMVGFAVRHLMSRDVTRPVDLEVEFLGIDPTGLQGEARIGFAARGAISRSDFGITFGLAADGAKIFLGDTVDLVLDVQAFPGA